MLIASMVSVPLGISNYPGNGGAMNALVGHMLAYSASDKIRPR